MNRSMKYGSADRRHSLCAAAILSVMLLSSCGSGSNSSPGDSTLSTSQESLAVGVLGSEVNSEDLPTQIESGPGSDVLVDSGDFLPVLFETQTTLDLEYASAGVEIVERLNESFILPADIDVVFADCGVANAFYVPAISFNAGFTQPDGMVISEGGAIFMCHELTELFSNFYADKDQSVSTSIFVLMHEIGHALVSQLQLPVLGIEESYVDGMAAVFVGEAGLPQGSVLAGWFFGSQPNTPFFDTHRAGPQRLGDLACWGIGADSTLLDDPTVGSISIQLMSGGRDCVAEYQQQRNGFEAVLAPYIRGDLTEIFDDTVPLSE